MASGFTPISAWFCTNGCACFFLFVMFESYKCALDDARALASRPTSISTLLRVRLSIALRMIVSDRQTDIEKISIMEGSIIECYVCSRIYKKNANGRRYRLHRGPRAVWYIYLNSKAYKLTSYKVVKVSINLWPWCTCHSERSNYILKRSLER